MNTVNKKHIALFIPSLRGGGAERMMVNLANGFVARGTSPVSGREGSQRASTTNGMDVDLVLAQKEGPYLNIVDDGVNIVDLRAKTILNSLVPLMRYLRKVKPDTMISSIDHVNIIALMAKFLTRAKTKIIIRIANTFSFSLKGTKIAKRPFRKYGAMLFYRFADTIVTNSAGSADDLAKTLHLARKPIKIIHNPTITPDIFDKAKEPVTHDWLTNKTNPVIIGVGRLHMQKDFSTLIRAFAHIKKHSNIRKNTRINNAKLIILGEGPERKKLEKLVQKLEVEKDIDMPGFVDNPYAYMSKADVFVLSSIAEGLPNVLIEAMAFGIPVVSTDCQGGGAREILRSGKYGPLVPMKDYKQLAQAIADTLDNPKDTQMLKDRANDFSADKIVNQYLELIFTL